MEKKLNNWTLNGIVALALSVAPCVFAQSMDSSSLGETSQVKSQLTLEDLETLLQSSNLTDETLQGLRLSELSPSARKQLLAKVSVLKKEKSKRIEEVQKQSMKLKAQLKEERKSIQQERLRTYGPMDEKAKIQLFANLIDEANVDAMIKNGASDIEQEYLVTVITHQEDDTKSLQSIAIKSSNLWSTMDGRKVAQN